MMIHMLNIIAIDLRCHRFRRRQVYERAGGILEIRPTGARRSVRASSVPCAVPEPREA